MSLAEPKSRSVRPLRRVLAAVRRRIRAYVAVEGLAATVAIAALGFWLAVGGDWFFDRFYQSPRWLRVGFVVVAAAAVVIAFWRRFLRRVFARLADRNVALVVERRYRDLQDALLTSIELDPAAQSDYGRAMLSDTRLLAEQRLASTDVGRLFDPRPRRKAVAAALLGVATIAGFAYGAPDLFRLGVERLTAKTDQAWPRRTRLSIVGFENGEKVVAQGADVEINVRADTTMEVPTDVVLRYRSDDGVRDEQPLEREGIARPGVDPQQNYKLILRGVSSSLTMEVRGGDDRIRNLRLRVVERPQVTMRLACKFPTYTGRAAAELDVTGAMALPQGTEVTVVAAANKPLVNVVVARPAAPPESREGRLDLAADGAPKTDFRFELGRVTTDELITFRLHDADGIDNANVLTLQAVVDAPPTIAVHRRGLEAVATPQARLAFSGQATDDYGVARLWFDYALDNGEPVARPTVAQPAGAREFTIAEGLELPEVFASRPLKPGQTLVVAVRGEDNRDLVEQPGGNLGAGDTATLAIVTDAELLRLLEAREIMFREQFKALIAKVTRSRDGLVDLGAPLAPKTPQPGEENEPAQTARDRDHVLVEQTRNREKEQRAETLQVADGFAAIVEELVNNRAADSERLQERLADDIAKPMRRIGGDLFADYEAKLLRLQTLVDKPSSDPAETAALKSETLASVDKILVEMQLVLEKMQELESFKEAIDLLKSIIAMQKEIGEQTKKSSKSASRLIGD